MTKDETERTREEKTTRTRKRKKMMKMITIWKNKTKQNKQTKQQQPQRKFQKSLYCIYPQLLCCKTQELEKGLMIKKQSRGVSITAGMCTTKSPGKISDNHGHLFRSFQAHQHGTPIVLENLEFVNLFLNLVLVSTVTGFYSARSTHQRMFSRYQCTQCCKSSCTSQRYCCIARSRGRRKAKRCIHLSLIHI